MDDPLFESFRNRKSKYTWTDTDFDLWCKEQAKQLRMAGFNISTAGVTRIVHHRVLIPNQINLRDIIKPNLKVRIK